MKQIMEVKVYIFFNDAPPMNDIFDNVQDACSYLQTQKCYSKENRYKWINGLKKILIFIL